MQQRIIGLVEFARSLLCAAEVLGQTSDISIGGHSGTLTLPSLPVWAKQEQDPLHKPLVGPPAARKWKRGEEPIYWGSPVAYPSGDSTVDRAVAEFALDSDNIEIAAKCIYGGFWPWLDLFENYVKIFTTQSTRRGVYVRQGPGRIELYTNEEARLRHVSDARAIEIMVNVHGQDEALRINQFMEASRLASSNLSPRLEYRILLEAYAARKNADYRKAIIEAATALEICLTACIMEELNAQGVAFGEQLLQKFRMLGGRFELARMIGISFPQKDYVALVINPRNDVIHRAGFPSEAMANQVISEVEELLRLFSPRVHQDAPGV
jgi:hypothetical protein